MGLQLTVACDEPDCVKRASLPLDDATVSEAGGSLYELTASPATHGEYPPRIEVEALIGQPEHFVIGGFDSHELRCYCSDHGEVCPTCAGTQWVDEPLEPNPPIESRTWVEGVGPRTRRVRCRGCAGTGVRRRSGG